MKLKGINQWKKILKDGDGKIYLARGLSTIEKIQFAADVLKLDLRHVRLHKEDKPFNENELRELSKPKEIEFNPPKEANNILSSLEVNAPSEPSRKVVMIDIEPLWVDLVPVLVELNDREFAIKEFTKIAAIADKVRQAQKKKEKIVFDFTEELQ